MRLHTELKVGMVNDWPAAMDDSWFREIVDSSNFGIEQDIDPLSRGLREAQCCVISATCSAIANEAVSPGDSMPKSST